MKGFKDDKGKFRPTERMKVTPELEKFRRELNVKELPDAEISKGLEKAEEFSLTPEFITKLKNEKERRLKEIQGEENELTEAMREIKPETVFFDNGDIESVDYEFTKDGRIFYPKGFEKEILIDFNAKKLSENEILDLIKKFPEFKKTRTDVDIIEEFTQENLTENTQFSDTVLDQEFEYGSVSTDVNEENERQYFLIRETGDTNIYDVTDLKGESVSGTGEPFSQINEFIFPQPILLFKFEGEDFAYDYVHQVVSTGFGKGSDEQVKELQKEKLSRINIVLDEFLERKGKEARRFFGNVAGR